MPRRLTSLALVALALMSPARTATAQTATPPPPGPIYIVQPNEYLSTIAERFNVSINDLMLANGIADPNLISQGQRLIIPGLQGINGILDTEVVAFGDSFRGLVRRTQIQADLLRRLNHVVSPTELYVGAGMIIPKEDDSVDLSARLGLSAGQSLLELAIAADADAWTLATLNDLGGSWDGLPGDVLYSLGSAAPSQSAAGLPPAFVAAEIPTLPLKQGSTAEIIVTPASGVTLSGTLVDYPLHFFQMADGRMVALQGIHAMLEPGVYPLQLDASLADGDVQSFQQLLVIASADFPKESLSVPAETIDPAVTAPEDALVQSIVAPTTDAKRWTSELGIPVAVPYCIKDNFGTRRSYNRSAYDYFHSGVDYGICSVDRPFDIYAAAPGKVVFSGPLNVRGNATFIDHGWGVYTVYAHQNATNVAVGDDVRTGQLIGEIGATGRVTGPHLHFEVWVGNVQVNPLEWLDQGFP